MTESKNPYVPPLNPERVAWVLAYMHSGASVGLGRYELDTIKACLEAVAQTTHPRGLAFTYDDAADILTVEGVKYSGVLFRNLGIAPGQQWFQIIARDADGVLTLHTDPTIGTDAARYRWLRHGDNDEQVLVKPHRAAPFLLRREHLDEAIDALRLPRGLETP